MTVRSNMVGCHAVKPAWRREGDAATRCLVVFGCRWSLVPWGVFLAPLFSGWEIGWVVRAVTRQTGISRRAVRVRRHT